MIKSHTLCNVNSFIIKNALSLGEPVALTYNLGFTVWPGVRRSCSCEGPSLRSVMESVSGTARYKDTSWLISSKAFSLKKKNGRLVMNLSMSTVYPLAQHYKGNVWLHHYVNNDAGFSKRWLMLSWHLEHVFGISMSTCWPLCAQWQSGHHGQWPVLTRGCVLH